MVGVVVDLGAGNDGRPFVEQPDERADDAGLRLAALAQQNDVVAGQDGVLQLGHDGFLETEHAGDQALSGRDGLGGVAPHLLGHRNRLPPRGKQVGEGPGQVVGRLQAAGGRGRGRVEALGGAVHGAKPTPPTCRAARRGGGGGRPWAIAAALSFRCRARHACQARPAQPSAPSALRRHAPGGCTGVAHQELVGQGARRTGQRAVAALGQGDGATQRRSRERDGDE